MTNATLFMLVKRIYSFETDYEKRQI